MINLPLRLRGRAASSKIAPPAAHPGPRCVIIFTPGQRDDDPTARVPRQMTTSNDDDPKAKNSPRLRRYRRVNNNNLASDPRDARTPRRRDDGNVVATRRQQQAACTGVGSSDKTLPPPSKRRKPHQYRPSPGCAVTQPAILQGHQGQCCNGTQQQHASKNTRTLTTSQN